MIDFNDGGLEALTIPKQPEYVCETCNIPRIGADYGLLRGKRNKECRVCARARWTRNRRLRLQTRKCLSCKKRLDFDSFPSQIAAGRQRLSMRCHECTATHKDEKDMARAQRAPIASHHRTPPGIADERTGATTSLDFSLIAQALLHPDRPRPRDYHSFSDVERAHIYALTRELSRRYSPMWRASFDNDPPRVDMQLRSWAEAFLLTAELPDVLLDFIASQMAPAAEPTIDELIAASLDAELPDDILELMELAS